MCIGGEGQLRTHLERKVEAKLVHLKFDSKYTFTKYAPVTNIVVKSQLNSKIFSIHQFCQKTDPVRNTLWSPKLA